MFADETRPFLQGARLTAWELVRDGIDTTVITESMAGPLMRAGDIDIVVVGADRIAANGDTANKIGTYTVAVLAHEHKVPFYVAAPLSTIDLATPDGDSIPIEERDQREVTHLGSARLTPEGAHIRNPAFDVTPHRYITGIITEKRHLRAAVHRDAEARLRGGRGHAVDREPSSRIETSCDETAAARRRRDRRSGAAWRIRSNIVASQTAIHREWGGVVPELASRQHVRDICGVVEAALAEAGVDVRRRRRRRRDAGAGLVGSLLVGVAFAKAFAWARGIPVVPVHHLAGHIESLVLAHGELPLPAAVLVVSGGHTSLYLVRRARRATSWSAGRETMRRGRRTTRWRKLLGLGYPGGPVIDRLARAGQRSAYRLSGDAADARRPQRAAATGPTAAAGRCGAAHRFQLQRAKTAVLRLVQRAAGAGRLEGRAGGRRCRRRRSPTSARASSAWSSRRCSIARSRRRAGWARAASGSPAACRRTAGCARTPKRAARATACRCSCRRSSLSTDNAAMIGAAGLRRYRARRDRRAGSSTRRRRSRC